MLPSTQDCCVPVIQWNQWGSWKVFRKFHRWRQGGICIASFFRDSGRCAEGWMFFELFCLMLLLFTLQGRSWQRSMFTAQCLTTSLQSSLLSSFLTLGVTRLPTSTASWVSSTIQMTMNSNAVKHVSLQTLPIFLFRKIQQLIKAYVAKTCCCEEFAQQCPSYSKATEGRTLAQILICAVLEATWSS